MQKTQSEKKSEIMALRIGEGKSRILKYRDRDLRISDWDEENSDAEELYNSPDQTRYDGVKNLWLSVIANAIQSKSAKFLRGKDDSNLKFACYAAGLDVGRVQEISRMAR
jgi:hypothetical protein